MKLLAYVNWPEAYTEKQIHETGYKLVFTQVHPTVGTVELNDEAYFRQYLLTIMTSPLYLSQTILNVLTIL
ncbi:unnamed protein product [Allacma fusca]|uniref:Uncharacterized protein n=1 Tax=Allacma fusca TaxID=39272 RepID=A0A8J2KED4_9HEXA|nr:unnamed protein product [Allacma fusca]